MNSKLIILVLGASSLMAFGEKSPEVRPQPQFDMLGPPALMALGGDYRFNFGDSAGWTYSVVDYTTGVEIRSGSAAWNDLNDYPNVETDPIGDNHGAAQALVGLSDYSKASPDGYLVLDFLSPDLTTSDDWQSASMFSARLLPLITAAAETPHIYASMLVIFKDPDTKDVKTFTTEATAIAHETWSYRDFDLASTIAAYSLVDYEVQQVIIRFWIASDGYLSDPVSFDIDNVLPRSDWTRGTHLGRGHLGPGFTLP